MSPTTLPLLASPRPRRTVIAALVLGLCSASLATAQEAPVKKKAAEINETPAQREARLFDERLARDAALARTRAIEAQQAAARRKNQKAMELMEEAWKLDPKNPDYAFYTGALAEAKENADVEFRAMAAFKVAAADQLKLFGSEPHPRKDQLEAMMAKADERLATLRSGLTTNGLRLRVEPKACEIYLDGAYVGTGEGTIETTVGGHVATTRCLGYRPARNTVTARLGDPASYTLRPDQVPYYGYLSIDVKPEGVEGMTIYLEPDDQAQRRFRNNPKELTATTPVATRIAAGPTPDGKLSGTGTGKDPFHLRAQKWIVRIEAPGHDRWHRRVEIQRDEVFKLKVKLETLEEAMERNKLQGI